ncbi:MAG: endolytic transglycosylase MltG [Chloroflexi bacterium]|nr:endolytic transglycosylase MltG [Chloroflexota bacterium]
MNRRAPSSWFITLLLAAFMLVACIVVFLVGDTIVRLPRQAQELYGPPSSNLSITQLYRLSAQLVWSQDRLRAPLDPIALEQEFTLELGESTGSLISRLSEQGLIQDAALFRDYLIYTGLDTQLQAGDYKLSAAMSSVEIAQNLLDATPADVQVTILPGWRMEEVAESLPTTGLSITPEEFLNAVQTRPAGFSFSGEAKSMEGYLLPFIYQVPREATVFELLNTIAVTFEEQVTDEIRGGFQQQGLSLEEAVILASIVQREAVIPDEQPLIASVLLNRIAIGMRLETDPTVQYALGYNTAQNTWWTNPLSLNDLAFNSPYNTYVSGGLPPGPISNPSVSAIRAVAFPEQSPYYFFRTTCDNSGRHNFAITFDEHLANACP